MNTDADGDIGLSIHLTFSASHGGTELNFQPKQAYLFEYSSNGQSIKGQGRTVEVRVCPVMFRPDAWQI